MKKEIKEKAPEKEKKQRKNNEEKEDGKIKKAFHKFLDFISNKWLVKGTTTVLLIVIILAVYVGVTKLLDNVTLPEFDMTENKIYSLSDETKTKVGSIDKDINITLINYANNSTVAEMVNRYKAINNKISVTTIEDLSSRADLMTKYSLDAEDTLIIIECNDKETTLSSSDLSTMDYSTYQTIDITEEALTNAIVGLTIETKPNVYIMSNHVQYPISTYFSTVMQKIENDANNVSTVDILSVGKIPDDCNCLIITSLAEDITEAERDSIISYIDKGGEILMLCGANLNGVSLPNFQSVLDVYGLSIEDGVIFEGSTSNQLSGYPDMIIEEETSNSTTKNKNMNLKGCLVDASAIKEEEDSEKIESLNVTYETLMQTSSSAFVRTNLNQSSTTRTSSDSEVGTYNVGVLATKTVGDNSTSKLIIYSNEIFASDMTITIGNYKYSLVNLYNNMDIVANSISYLNEREDTITIRKNYDSVTYSVTTQQHSVIMAIIFITPIVIIIAGVVVWQVRRRKK